MSKRSVRNKNIIKIKQTIEAKRDEFTDYLEKHNVIDNLTEVLINLYEEGEKPKFPIDYLKKNLKSCSAGENEVILQNNKLREENKRLKAKVTELEKTYEKLKKELGN